MHRNVWIYLIWLFTLTLHVWMYSIDALSPHMEVLDQCSLQSPHSIVSGSLQLRLQLSLGLLLPSSPPAVGQSRVWAWQVRVSNGKDQWVDLARNIPSKILSRRICEV